MKKLLALLSVIAFIGFIFTTSAPAKVVRINDDVTIVVDDTIKKAQTTTTKSTTKSCCKKPCKYSKDCNKATGSKMQKAGVKEGEKVEVKKVEYKDKDKK